MNIRVRTLLIFFVAVAVLFGMVYLLTSETILRKFAELDLTQGRTPGVIFEAGARAVQVFQVTFAAAGGILFFLMWYLLDWSVLAPIQRLSAVLRSATGERKKPTDLRQRGTGEIATLASDIERLADSLARAQEQYRTVVEEQTDLIFRYTPDGRVTFVNRAACGFLRRRREELLGMEMAKIFTVVDREEAVTTQDRLTAQTPSVALEQVVMGPYGGRHWLARTDRGTFDGGGKLVEVQVVLRDVTESRQAQKILEESERRYRGFFEAAADGIVLLDAADDRIQDVNPGLCSLFGYDRRHFIGMIFWQIAPFSELLPVRLDPEGDGEDGGVERFEVARLRDAEGRLIYLDLVVVRYRAGNRDVVQWNFRDVTAQRNSDEAMRALSGRLLRLQDDERRRIARELHDSTGQNLSALEMNLAMLATQLSASGGQTARLIEDSRALADRSCSEIRTISYLLHPPLLDEAGLIFALKWFAEGFARRSGIAMELELAEDLPRLPEEVESTLFRVAQEALTNIHRHAEGTRAALRLRWSAGRVTLEIEDNGKGMTTQQVRSANRADALLGVGLAGMHQRLAQLQGELRIMSGRKGTTVRASVVVQATEGDPGVVSLRK